MGYFAHMEFLHAREEHVAHETLYESAEAILREAHSITHWELFAVSLLSVALLHFIFRKTWYQCFCYVNCVWCTYISFPAPLDYVNWFFSGHDFDENYYLGRFIAYELFLITISICICILSKEMVVHHICTLALIWIYIANRFCTYALPYYSGCMFLSSTFLSLRDHRSKLGKKFEKVMALAFIILFFVFRVFGFTVVV